MRIYVYIYVYIYICAHAYARIHVRLRPGGLRSMESPFRAEVLATIPITLRAYLESAATTRRACHHDKCCQICHYMVSIAYDTFTVHWSLHAGLVRARVAA